MLYINPLPLFPTTTKVILDHRPSGSVVDTSVHPLLESLDLPTVKEKVGDLGHYRDLGKT